MKITLNKPKEIIVKEAVVKTTDSIDLHSIKDDANNRLVVATVVIDKNVKQLVLW